MIALLHGLMLSALVLAARPEPKRPDGPRVIYSYDTPKPEFALTFDDGPLPSVTPRLLAILRRHKAKATFFVIGRRVQQYPDLVRQEVAEGHEIANHTMTHRYLRHPSAEQLKLEVAGAHDLLAKLAKAPPTFYRPPGAIYNKAMLAAADALGEHTILWNIETKDWQGRNHTVMTNHVLKNLSAGDIVIFHDGVERTQTLQAVDEILTAVDRRGLRAVTLAELSKDATARHGWGHGQRAPAVSCRGAAP